MRVGRVMLWAAVAALGLGTLSVQAQEIQTIDPNSAIDADLYAPPPPPSDVPPETPVQDPYQDPYQAPPADPYAPPSRTSGAPTAPDLARTQATDTFQRGELVDAAENVFGKGASGLAGIIEDILKDQGEPNAYIAGSEASGAFILGLRYGSGEMFHKIEGRRPVYWTGPSVGFDVGGDAAKVFVLVYNLYDSQELYRRFPAGEGRLYFVGGFSAGYLRRGNIVLIPVRLGVGWRAGVNAGYMKFSERRRILPF